MTCEFDKLLSLAEKMNSVKGEECMICHFPDTVDNLLKLKCGHYYHKSCIGITDHTISKILKCPYCKKKTTYKNKINKKSKKVIIDLPKPKKICFEMIKSGPKKGMVCGRSNCKYHKNSSIPILSLEPTCKQLIKSGPKKGNVCGRKNCKYHKSNNIIV